MNAGNQIENNRSYPVTIQRLVKGGKDPDGFPQDDHWDDYYSNYAYINNLSGNERWMAAQVEQDMNVRFVFRWNKKLDCVQTKDFRIKWGSRYFNITFVDNVQYKNESIKIDALEVS